MVGSQKEIVIGKHNLGEMSVVSNEIQSFGNVQEESSRVGRQRNLVTNDPCLEYFDPTTKLLCKTCDNTDPANSFELFIMSPTIVHCASHVPSDSVCTVYDLTIYSDAVPETRALLTYY